MNEIVIGLNGWALLGIGVFSAIFLIAGWKFYQFKKTKNQIAQAEKEEKRLQREKERVQREKERLQIEQKNKEMLKQERLDNLTNLEHAFYLIEKESVDFPDRDQSAVKFYRDVVAGKETRIYRSALDFNRFFQGMTLAQEGLQSFTKADSIRKILECFSEYALVAALYFFKDSGYTKSAKGSPQKFSEAKRFMSEEYGIHFEVLSDEKFYEVVRVIAETTVKAEEADQEKEELNGSAAAQREDQVGVA